MIIYNRHFPIAPFYAINLCGIIFCRSDKGRMDPVTRNHEHIHTMQQREMLYIFFLLWYVMEWLFYLAKYRKPLKAYYNISFEREAYAMQHDLTYRHHRHHFAWFRLFFT